MQESLCRRSLVSKKKEKRQYVLPHPKGNVTERSLVGAKKAECNQGPRVPGTARMLGVATRGSGSLTFINRRKEGEITERKG